MSHSQPRPLALISALAALVIGLASCKERGTESVSTPTPSEAESRELRPLRVQLAWIYDAEFMGYYIAKDKGWYEEAGLEVELIEGGPDIIPESRLLSGTVDVALTTPDTTANLIIKDGYPLKIVATQYQRSPLGVVSLAETGIERPADLVGKTLAVPPVNVLSVEAMLRLNDIDPDSVNIVPYQYDPKPLISGDVDATVDFTTNVPYVIESQGFEVNHFLLYDHGFTIYNDTVVVTADVLKARAEDIAKFIEVSRRGWEENYKDPNAYPKTLRDTWFKGNGREIALEESFNRRQEPLMTHPDGFFAMDESAIRANIKALSAIGLQLPDDVFDLSVLEMIDD